MSVEMNVEDAVTFLKPFADKCLDARCDLIYGHDNEKAGRALRTVLAALATTSSPDASPDRVLAVIKAIRDAHPGMVDIFTWGSCYHLYNVLRVIWPEARAHYDLNHVTTRIGETLYDINGVWPGEMDEMSDEFHAPDRQAGKVCPLRLETREEWCARPKSPDASPDSGEARSTLMMAVDQNDRMRQELAHVGNLVSDLARAMKVEQANEDGTWPDLAGCIGKLIEAARQSAASPASLSGGAEEAVLAGRAVLAGEGDGTYDEACDAIRQLIAAIPSPEAPANRQEAGEIVVKDLPWIEPHPSHSYPNWHALVPSIRFEARIDTGKPLMYGRFPLAINGSMVVEKFDTVEAAKAYAQRNFANRVLALTSPKGVQGGGR